MLTPIKAIRANCLDCMCGQANEVALCPSVDCPLYSYRTGHGPKKELTDEQKAKKLANFNSAPKIARAGGAQNTSDLADVKLPFDEKR